MLTLAFSSNHHLSTASEVLEQLLSPRNTYTSNTFTGIHMVGNIKWFITLYLILPLFVNLIWFLLLFLSSFFSHKSSPWGYRAKWMCSRAHIHTWSYIFTHFRLWIGFRFVWLWLFRVFLHIVLWGFSDTHTCAHTHWRAKGIIFLQGK